MDLATQGLIANSQKHLQDRTMSSSPEDDSIQQLKYAAVGSAAALAVDKSFDTLVISKQGHDKSLLGKAVAKIDNFVKNNAFMQSAEKKIESFANTVKTKNAELIAKSPAYKEVAELFNKGYKTKTMLTREPLLKTYEDISKNGRKKLIEARRNNGVIAGAKKKFEKFQSDLFPKATQNKIKILRQVNNEGSFLSKMLAKTSIGVGNYIGGSPFNLLINGYFLGLSYKEAQHAKEGEKMSSFMEDMLGNWIGGYLMMSPIAKVLNGVSELKHYKMGAESVGKVQTLSSALKEFATKGGSIDDLVKLGLKPEQIDKLTPIVDKLNASNAGNGIGNKIKSFFAGQAFKKHASKIVNQEYSEASKAASSFLNKTVRFIGRLASPSAENATMMRKLPTGIKRLGLVLLLTAPFIAAFKKISHVFFGKPSPKEEAGQASNPAQSQTQFSDSANMWFNILNQKQAQQYPQYNQYPQYSQPQYQQPQYQQPQQPLNPPKIDNYTYIPSPAAAKLSQANTGTNQFEQKLKNVDDAQKEAEKLLKGF